MGKIDLLKVSYQYILAQCLEGTGGTVPRLIKLGQQLSDFRQLFRSVNWVRLGLNPAPNGPNHGPVINVLWLGESQSFYICSGGKLVQFGPHLKSAGTGPTLTAHWLKTSMSELEPNWHQR